MKLLLKTLIFVAVTSFAVTCSSNVAKEEKVVVSDASQSVNENSNKVSHTEVTDLQPSVERRSSISVPQKAGDYSEIVTMLDGFGNKVESRSFKMNPRLSYMTIRTYTNGEKMVEVFGHNGERRVLPSDYYERALTITADEAANAAGIYETKKTPAPPINFNKLSQDSQNNLPKEANNVENPAINPIASPNPVQPETPTIKNGENVQSQQGKEEFKN